MHRLAPGHVEYKPVQRGQNEIFAKERRGRTPGCPNKLTVDLKFAISEAAVLHGYDGNGLGGLTGYCYMLAERDPKTFTSLLRALLPLNIKTNQNRNAISFGSIAEAEAALKERGIPVADIFKLAYHKDTVIDNPDGLDDDKDK